MPHLAICNVETRCDLLHCNELVRFKRLSERAHFRDQWGRHKSLHFLTSYNDISQQCEPVKRDRHQGIHIGFRQVKDNSMQTRRGAFPFSNRVVFYGNKSTTRHVQAGCRPSSFIVIKSSRPMSAMVETRKAKSDRTFGTARMKPSKKGKKFSVKSIRMY